MKRLAVSLIAAAWLLGGSAADTNAVNASGFADKAPDNIRVSLLVTSPGGDLATCVGHSAIRLECPAQKLDRCYTYEGVRPGGRLSSYLARRRKMAMVAVATKDYLESFRVRGRGVWQYELQLPPEANQRLFEHLEKLVGMDPTLSPDYIEHGCTRSVLDCLRVACAPMKLTGQQLRITQREMLNRELSKTHPWNLVFLNAIVGMETNVSTEAVTPQNLLDYLRTVRLEGKNVMVANGKTLLPQTLWFDRTWLSPLVVSIALLVLVVVAGIRRWCPVMITIFVFQFLLGLFFMYLMLFAQLPDMAWNWLVVLFNPVMPVMAFWKKARPAAHLLYAFGLLVWVGCFAFLPQVQTDPTYLVLGVTLAVVYACWARKPVCRPLTAE